MWHNWRDIIKGHLGWQNFLEDSLKIPQSFLDGEEGEGGRTMRESDDDWVYIYTFIWNRGAKRKAKTVL